MEQNASGIVLPAYRSPPADDTISTDPSLQAQPSGIAQDDSKEKRIRLQQACEHGNIHVLVAEAASSGGFLDDSIRQQAWPIILGCNTSEYASDQSWKTLPAHTEEEQIEKDVNRAFVYYPEHESEIDKDRRKHELSDLICNVMRRYPQLSYFQGYHDIVQVFLLVLGPQGALPAVEHLSLLRIRDFMLPALAPAMLQLRIIPAILFAADPTLCDHLKTTQPFYALSATLTLYSHDVQEYADIARLFDFLLSREAVMPIYLYAAIILDRRDQLLEIAADDSDMQLFQLSRLPQPLDLERLIQRAIELFDKHPPESLPFGVWRRLSKCSALKTTRGFDGVPSQTIAQGQQWFREQAVEWQRQQRLQNTAKLIKKLLARHGRPTALTLLAVGVGLIAWSLSTRHEAFLYRVFQPSFASEFVKEIRNRVLLRFTMY